MYLLFRYFCLCWIHNLSVISVLYSFSFCVIFIFCLCCIHFLSVLYSFSVCVVFIFCLCCIHFLSVLYSFSVCVVFIFCLCSIHILLSVLYPFSVCVFLSVIFQFSDCVAFVFYLLNSFCHFVPLLHSFSKMCVVFYWLLRSIMHRNFCSFILVSISRICCFHFLSVPFFLLSTLSSVTVYVCVISVLCLRVLKHSFLFTSLLFQFSVVMKVWHSLLEPVKEIIKKLLINHILQFSKHYFSLHLLFLKHYISQNIWININCQKKKQRYKLERLKIKCLFS